jgi:uncharacterized protein YndB with AHSA1/START domain
VPRHGLHNTERVREPSTGFLLFADTFAGHRDVDGAKLTSRGPLVLHSLEEDMASKLLTIDQAYFYEASPRRVYRALTSPPELARWFLAKADLPLRKGAPYRFEWPGGYSHTGRVVEVVPNRSLTLDWANGPAPRQFRTRVTFSLRSAGAGTFLKVHHSGFPRTRLGIEQYGGSAAGWAYYFVNLRSILTGGSDLRSPRDG